MPNKILNEFLPPLQHPQAAMRVQFGQGAVLQQFAKPTPLFEHEDEHEHEHEDDFDAPCEGGALLSMCPGVETPGSVLLPLRDKEFYTDEREIVPTDP
jgi:hypothetical protein